MSSRDHSQRPDNSPSSTRPVQTRARSAAPGKVATTQRIPGGPVARAPANAPAPSADAPVQRRAATATSPASNEFGGVLPGAGVPLGWGASVPSHGGGQQGPSGSGSQAVQGMSLRQTVAAALTPEPAAGSHAPVQCKLADDARGMLEVHGPVDYNGLVAAIHGASTAERQEVLNDSALRALINQRLSGEWAQTVMSSLLEGSQEWQNPPANDFFDYFVTNGGTGTLPNTATMNCWESIMYAAYLANQVSAAWIASFYQQALAASDPNAEVWSLLGFSTALPTYAAPGTTAASGTVTPAVGQLLFYHGGGSVPGHVAVSLGGDQAISLWNQPNNVDAVQRIRVTDLAGTVYVGNPPW